MPSRSDILNAKILVVDDCADNLDLLHLILEQVGYTNVQTTTNSAEVCTRHETENFDLIILDLQMPGMNGFDVMAGLKEIEKDGYLPVLALTGQSSFKIQALEAGAKDFISKPYDMLEVHKRIHNMLEVRLLYKELAEYSRAQQALALHDPLTGLPNRRLLDDRLETAIQAARRHHLKVAVMYLDLDGFKDINDSYGHAYGDALLIQVAKRLTATSRAVDTVARIGGDEFIVVLADLQRVADIDAPASKLVEVIAEPYVVEGQTLHVTVSLGICVYPDHALSVDTLMSGADEALYDAKRGGKNRFRVASRVNSGSSESFYKNKM